MSRRHRPRSLARRDRRGDSGCSTTATASSPRTCSTRTARSSRCVREHQLRAQLKRDRGGAGAALAARARAPRAGRVDDARNELEQVVADDPAFAWAWLDLARISEQARRARRRGRRGADGRRDGRGHAAPAGRLLLGAARAPREPHRRRAAARRGRDEDVAARARPQARPARGRARVARGAATPSLGEGLLELLRAVWPRDLEVLELARRVEQRSSASAGSAVKTA